MLTANSWAITAKGGNSVYIPKDEVIEGDLFVGAGVIIIDGTVTGDLFFGGNTININGEVKGDIIGGGGSFTLNGVAGDDVRVWCGSITINGKIEKSLTAFGGNVVLTKNSVVKRDVLIGCDEANISGEIFGELRASSGNIQLTGSIGKKADLKAGAIIISPSAKITGNLKYRAKKVDIKEGAVIEGKIEKLPYKKKKSKWFSWKFYTFKLIFMIGAIIVGLILIKFFPKLTLTTIEQVRSYWKSFGIGFIVLICLPVASVIVAITIIGIPVALILLFFYFLFLYIGKILVSLAVGAKILKSRENASLWALALGMFIFTVLYNIPYIGWIIKLITIILGLGALSVSAFKLTKEAV
jgi:cytoskeletal protein CcmA (bactofilin family)